MASNCLAIVLRALAIRSVRTHTHTHDVRTFSISTFLRFYSLWRTRNETRRNKKRNKHVVYYRFVNAEHTQKLHSYTESYHQKEVLCSCFAVRSQRSFCGAMHFMIHDDDDATLWNYDEKSQFTYLRMQCRTTALCTLSQYIQTNNDDILQHSENGPCVFISGCLLYVCVMLLRNCINLWNLTCKQTLFSNNFLLLLHLFHFSHFEFNSIQTSRSLMDCCITSVRWDQK